MTLTIDQPKLAEAIKAALLFLLLSLPATYRQTYKVFHTVPGTLQSAALHSLVYGIVAYILLAYV